MIKERLTLEQELAFCEDYQNSRLSKKELIIKHNITHWTFTSIREKHNISKRKRNAPTTKKLIALDERYFQNIDTNDRAYWLGFIAADGCILERLKRKENYILSIGLSIKDITHLEKFKKDISADFPIVINNQFHKKMKKYYETAYLRVSRTIMCEDLINHGVGRKKSQELSLPNLPDNLMRHYIRGYFDGDGCWTISRQASMCFGIISSVESFAIELREFIKNKCALENSAKLSFNKNAYQFIYGGNIQCKRIYDYLYGDGGPWLDRKYEKSTNHFITRGSLKESEDVIDLTETDISELESEFTYAV